jgi:hypothetical protein
MNVTNLAKHCTKVTLWWAALSNEQRPPFMRPKELESALQTPMQCLATPLRLAGWRRELCSLGGVQTAIWVPPSPHGISPKRPRGRPTTASIMAGIYYA